MGASVPSTSSRTAERLGSERSGSSASASGAATDTQPMIAGMPRSRTLKLAAIAAAAGLFSGLFGVGGGDGMGPPFILWLGPEGGRGDRARRWGGLVIPRAAGAGEAGPRQR